MASMNDKLLILLLIFFNIPTLQASENCTHWPDFSQHACKRLHQIWTQGDNELYVTGYAWHNRSSYSQQRIESYNENAWGGGLGKSFYDEDGDWHGLYAFGFLDSHKNVEPVAGYAFLKMASLTSHIKAGAGLSLFVTARPDIFNNIPFPGALPWLSLTIHRATLSATYIPGAQGAGNVLFLFGKWRF